MRWFILISSCYSHGNMLSPKPRGNTQWSGYCSRGQGCKTTCDSPKSQSTINAAWTQPQVITRGGKLTVQWLRSNHPGGFVKLAIIPFDQSDDQSSFDQNIVKYVCYETNCKEDQSDSMLGALNGPGFGICSTDLTIPTNLPDGKVTLQWTWFGGGIYYAEQNTTFANYVSCADMVVQGGKSYSKSNTKPTFQGGDAGNPNSNQCRYWGFNQAGECPGGFEKGESCGKSNQLNGSPAGF